MSESSDCSPHCNAIPTNNMASLSFDIFQQSPGENKIACGITEDSDTTSPVKGLCAIRNSWKSFDFFLYLYLKPVRNNQTAENIYVPLNRRSGFEYFEKTRNTGNSCKCDTFDNVEG